MIHSANNSQHISETKNLISKKQTVAFDLQKSHPSIENQTLGPAATQTEEKILNDERVKSRILYFKLS